MVTPALDMVDTRILHFLQQDARNMTPVDMARHLDVSDGTVRNRIEKLEDNGIIRGYVPILDYEAAGFPLRIVFNCTAPVTQRDEFAEQALEVHNVINVREMLTARENIRVFAIALDSESVTRIAEDLVDIGVEIEDEELVRTEYSRPFNHFGSEPPADL